MGERKIFKMEISIKRERKRQITEYTKNASPINSYLRENDGNLGPNPEMDKKIELMDKALKKTKLHDSITVYRGTDGIIFGEEFQTTLMNGNKVNEEVAMKIREQFEGTVLLERGYLSTSIVLGIQFRQETFS
ncbi:ADP-ribosyltransferase [Paenibacillus larvae]|nr:ADP-ribosyltransferase [Paenibacillus larvae]MDT2246722.1 ADP-ribosyltransferase [Paenibacillus larvae]MDT2262974.1 ADP-ribosyltransferase [Paenibacillus larvae]